jgi:hypothetical protein
MQSLVDLIEIISKEEEKEDSGGCITAVVSERSKEERMAICDAS